VFRDDAELYDPETDTWTQVGPSMDRGRSTHASIRTPAGDVILIGGTFGGPSASRFNTSDETFSNAVGTPLVEHVFAAWAPLPGGRAMVAGGFGTTRITIWDPSFGFLGGLNTMIAERVFATATPVPDGRVFLVGGFDANAVPPLVHATLDVYFPKGVTGEVLRAPAVLPAPTTHHAAALGPDGKIWVTGGLPPAAGEPALRQVTVILPDPEED
jgi:hypothetical protein